MPYESPEDIHKKAHDAINEKFDPDFEKKFETVKPALELFEKTGYTSEQQRINAEARMANQKKEDGEKIEAIRSSLGLEPLHDEPIPNYTEVRNEKTGRSILFPKESILSNSQEDPETKYTEVKNEHTGRSILFAKEDIEQAKNRASVEDLLKIPNELATNLKKEEQLLTYIENEITKTKAHLENLQNTNYIDQVVDQYQDATRAGEELRAEHDSLRAKLNDLTVAQTKTKEAITAIETKLAQ